MHDKLSPEELVGQKMGVGTGFSGRDSSWKKRLRSVSLELL